MRESNASVSSCAFDNGAPRFYLAPLFSIFNNIKGGTIFDAAAWILKFGFAEDLAAGLVGEGF